MSFLTAPKLFSVFNHICFQKSRLFFRFLAFTVKNPESIIVRYHLKEL